MGLISNFQRNRQANKLAKAIVNEGFGFKAAGGGGGLLSQIASMLQPKWAEAPSRDIREWLDLFTTSPRLDPVHKIAEDVATADWGIYKRLGDGEKEKVEDHPLILLFNKPNPLPETTWSSLLYSTEAYLYVAGEAFWVIERSGLNQINEIWILPPNWVESTPNQGQDYYEVQTADGVRMTIPQEDMIYFKEPNLRNPYGRGKGRARAIGDEIETDEYMAKWAKNFFYNDAKPPFVIEAPGASKPDVDRMQESWMQKYGGLNNAHKPAVLPFAGKLHQLGTNAKEMDFVQSRKFLRDQANQHFRVPPELMGIIENSNRATIDAADYIYRSSVLINRLSMIEKTIQHQIINRFFESENLVFEFENVVPDDKEFELKVANEGLSRAAITVDEWRQKNGMDPLENGQGAVFLVPAGVTPVSSLLEVNDMRAALAPQPATGKEDDEGEKPEDNDKPTPPKPNKPEPKPPEEEEDEDTPIKGWRQKGFTGVQVKNIAERFDNKLTDLEKPHAKTVEKFLKAQGKRVADFIKKKDIKEVVLFNVKADGDDEPTEDEILEAQRQADELLEDYDWVDEDGKMHEEMAPHLLSAAEQGAKLANGLFELGIAFDLIREEMLDHINSEGFDKVVGITGTTKELLRNAVAQGILEGEGSPALAKRIRETASEYAYHRSFTIARTESHSTMVKGTIETYKQAGATKKEWLTVRDGRERPSHKKLNGKKIAIEEEFSNKCKYPGDSKGPAEEVIQCRCALLPVFED
jgi:HK97 family phage portal protein